MIAFHRAAHHPVPSSRRQTVGLAGRLLLLEDDTFVGPMLVEQLADAGYAVNLCGTLKEARKALTEMSYQVALIDQHLPDGTGIGFLQELRGQNNNLPVVVLSGDMFSADLRIWLHSTNADALSKPFVIGRLLETISRLCNASWTGVAA